MKSRSLAVGTSTVLCVLALAVSYRIGRAHADGVPATMALYYSGSIEDAGRPVPDGPRNILLLVWDAGTAGTTVCTTTASATPVVSGRFRVPLVDACATAVRANPDLWIEVHVDGMSFGRTKLAAVPYAIEAGRAAGASGALQARIAAVESASTRQVAVSARGSVGANYCAGTGGFAIVPGAPTLTLTASASGLYRVSSVVGVGFESGCPTTGNIRARIAMISGSGTVVWQQEAAATVFHGTAPIMLIVQLTAGTSYTFGIEGGGSAVLTNAGGGGGGAVIIAEQL